MKLSELDEQTITDLRDALSRRFSSAEERAILFEAAGLNVTILKGTNLSKFWDILLKNIEDNELATHRLLQAAVDLRPTDYNLRTIHRLFVGPPKKKIPLTLVAVALFIFMACYAIFEYVGGDRLQHAGHTDMELDAASQEMPDEPFQADEKNTAQLNSQEMVDEKPDTEKPIKTPVVSKPPTKTIEPPAKEPPPASTLPAKPENKPAATEKSQNSSPPASSEPEKPPEKPKAPSPSAVIEKPQAATPKPETATPKSPPPSPTTKGTNKTPSSTPKTLEDGRPKPFPKCFASTTNKLIGYWFAGEDPPGKIGRKIKVGRWTHVRNAIPSSSNGFRRGDSVCVLRPWNQIRISQKPILVKGAYYWLPLYSHDILR